MTLIARLLILSLVASMLLGCASSPKKKHNPVNPPADLVRPPGPGVF